MFVLGDRAGQKVFPPGMERGAPAGVPYGNMQAAMLAQQNSQMEAMERRNRERDRSGSVTGVRVSILKVSCVMLMRA